MREGKGSGEKRRRKRGPGGGDPAEERPGARGPGRDLRLLGAVGAVVVLAAAAALAAVAMPAPHPGGDNAGYLTLAHALIQGEGYTELWDPARPPHSKYPPLYPLVLSGAMVLGAQTWSAFKLIPAVGISLAVLLTYLWASRRRGPVFGGAVALLVLLSAGWLEASRWILSEPLFLVLVLGSILAGEAALGGGTEARPGDDGGAGGGPNPRGRARADVHAPGEGPAVHLLLAVAGALAILAFLTRSAGLPLVLALLGALVFARRPKAAALTAAAFAVPALLWLFRARRGGEGAYADEFWLRNPYEPELGTIGIPGLVGRVWTNLRLYVGEVLPGEWWGFVEAPAVLAAAGIALVAAGTVGWVRRLRPRPGPAELFVPLYLGLVLLWPEVWSGDRFVLPLYPLVLVYAGEAILDGAARLGRSGPGVPAAVGAVLFLVLALPAVGGWMEKADEASFCRRAGAEDVFRCYGDGIREFREVAAWSGANLPEGAVVLNRKPRIFYALGGTPGRTFPFTRNPDALLADADALGARYLLLDHWDGISGYYLPELIRARPGAFCWIGGWGGEGGGPGTDLFGILPPGERREGMELREMQLCPPGYRAAPPEEPRTEGRRVPILVRAAGRRSRAVTRPGALPARRRGGPGPPRSRGMRSTGRFPPLRSPGGWRRPEPSAPGRGIEGRGRSLPPETAGSPRSRQGIPGGWEDRGGKARRGRRR